MTVSQSNWRSSLASCPHTCAARSVCCQRIAHWQYWRLCRPERKMKWPSSSAPVLRNSARRSSLMRTNENDRQDARRPHRLEAYVPLPGSVIRRLLGLPGICNSIDLYLRSLGQRGDLDSGTGRGILFEIRAINFVYGLEIFQICEENRCLNDVIKSESFSSQNGCDVVQHAPRLRRDIAGNDLARLRIERNLTAAKEETSAAHRLRVGADRRRRFIRGNDLLHLADCSRKSSGHNEWSRRVRKCLGAENVLTSQDFCRAGASPAEPMSKRSACPTTTLR